MLTVEAKRTSRDEGQAEAIVVERPTGTFRRQLVIGDGLDTDRVSATYNEGVLTGHDPYPREGQAAQDRHHAVRVPVIERDRGPVVRRGGRRRQLRLIAARAADRESEQACPRRARVWRLTTVARPSL